MNNYTVVIKQTHYYQYEVQAYTKEEACSKIHDDPLVGEGKNVDEFFGDWQKMAEGEIVSVVENGGES